MTEQMHPLDKFKYCPACGSARWEINNVKSKHCRDCGFTYYANPCSATAAFIVRPAKPATSPSRREESGCAKGSGGCTMPLGGGEYELLVVRRAKEPAKGTLDLPGGFVDMDETGEEGMLREIQEETGLQLAACRYLFSIPNRYDYSGMTIHTLDMFFRCDVPAGTQAVANDDAAECLWLPLGGICPDDFGLLSIRQAVSRFISL